MVQGPFKTDDVTLTILDLFDWSQLGYLDLRYYVVLIESLRARPEMVGHHALVDASEVNVALDDITAP